MKKFWFMLLVVLFPLCSKAQSSNALAFDNIDDHTYTPNGSMMIAGSNTISLSFWVYPQNSAPVYPDLEGFAGFRNNTNADFYILQLSPTAVEARFRNSSGVAYDIVFSGLLLNNWQHFALVLDGTTLNLYHNGMMAGSATVSGNISAVNESFFIGMLPWTSASFFLNGKMDEVSLWNKALSASELTCIMEGGIDPADPDLQLYYSCNEGTAGGNNTGITSLTDISGNTNAIITGFAMSGTVSNFVGGITTPSQTATTDILCPGTSYTFGSQVLTAPGTYFEVFPGSAGCDSLVQLTLTSATINTSISQSGPVLLSQQAGAAYQWVDCQNGNAPIPGATAQQFTATANGQYAVIVTLGGCSDTSLCVNVVNVGVYEITEQITAAGPNPFTNQLVINTTSPDSEMHLTIFDQLGRLFYEINNSPVLPVTIDTSSWPAGVYILIDKNRSFHVRCVKIK
jgi:hypothetical protein